MPFLEKYRGTHYAVASAKPQRPLIELGRTRLLMVVALLAVAALYGALVSISDLRAEDHRPEAPLGLILTR